MAQPSAIVLGGRGLVGSAVSEHLQRAGYSVLAVGSTDYAKCVGERADIVINCNGNAYRYRANNDPSWNFDASVGTVQRSFADLSAGLYVFISTVDIYDRLDHPHFNREDAQIDYRRLDSYGFHKWLAERVVEKYAQKFLILRVGTVIGEGMKKGPVYDLLQKQPLRMSLDSELTLVDTITLSHAVETLLQKGWTDQIVNTTGTGSVSMRDLASLVPAAPAYAPEAPAAVFRYHVNNEKLRTILPVPSSFEIGSRFLREHTSYS